MQISVRTVLMKGETMRLGIADRATSGAVDGFQIGVGQIDFTSRASSSALRLLR